MPLNKTLEGVYLLTMSKKGIVERLDHGHFTYIITTRRITSGEELTRRNGQGGLALLQRLIRLR